MNQEDKKDKANGGSLSHVLADKAEDLNSEMASSKAVSKPKRKTNMSRLREAVRDWEKKAREATASEREMAKEVEMMKVDRQIVEETIDRLQQKLQIEGQARLHAEQALALAQTNLQDQEIRFQLDRDRLLGLLSGKDEALISLQTQTSLAVAVKAEAETAVGVAMANLQDARRITQELKDRLTSHLQAWEKERQELRSQKNQAVEALKISEQGLTRTTAKLLEVGNRVPSPAQLGVKIQTEISALKAQLFAAHSARTRAEMTCKMTRANLANLEKNLCAEVAKRDDNILILSNEKKEALQVTKKGEQELEAFRSNLMKMAGSMTKLQLDLRDKGNHCSVLEKALEEVQEDLRQTRKELIWLENIHLLTLRKKYELRVDMEDFEGVKVHVQYSSFSVGTEQDGYQLDFSGFTDGGAGKSMAEHNGKKFSTFDKDQDTYSSNCAKTYLGGWWYGECHSVNPNGQYLWGNSIYGLGINWSSFKGYEYSLKAIEMKIRPV